MKPEMTEKVIITVEVQGADYKIPVYVPVIRRGISEKELERRASNIFHEFLIKKIKLIEKG